MPGNKDYYAEGIVLASVLDNVACFSWKVHASNRVAIILTVYT